MSDHIKGFVVTLDGSYKDEDANRIGAAIAMIKGVLSATPSIDDFNDRMNRERVKYEIHRKIFEAIQK